MNHRVKVKEPPRNGDPSRARYHLKDDFEVIGWTDDHGEAYDWLKGFGPSTAANVEDRRSWAPRAAIRGQ
tara:strand:- start:14 stop:223 length:210 start_codon:yes stop_codon:yes gene_type:complete